MDGESVAVKEGYPPPVPVIWNHIMGPCTETKGGPDQPELVTVKHCSGKSLKEPFKEPLHGISVERALLAGQSCLG